MRTLFLCVSLLFIPCIKGQFDAHIGAFVTNMHNAGTLGGLHFEIKHKKNNSLQLKIGTQNYVPYEEKLFQKSNSDFTRQDSLPLVWGQQKNNLPIYVGIGYTRKIFTVNKNISFNIGLDLSMFQRNTSLTKTLIGITVDDGVMPADAKLAADYCFKTIENTKIQNISVVVPFSLNIMISKRTHLQLFTGFGYQRNYKTKEFTRLQDGYMYLYTDMPGYSEITKESNNSVGNIYRYGIKMSLKL